MALPRLCPLRAVVVAVLALCAFQPAAADGRSLATLPLEEVVASPRGGSGDVVTPAIARPGAPDVVERCPIRRTVEMPLSISANSGVSISIRSDAELLGNEGWWGAAVAGAGPDHLVNRSSDVLRTLLLPPGTYDIWWQVGPETAPQLKASGVVVEPGRIAEVIITGEIF